MKLARLRGMARSLAIYHGIPGRAARLRRFYAAFVGPGDLCFDIGAHVGNHTRCWRHLGATVVALEPQADFAGLLRRLFAGQKDVTVIEAAVGERVGGAILRSSEKTPTVSTLSHTWIEQVSREPGFEQVSWSGRDEVRLTTLAELISSFGEPAFIKIDVEGFELEVLKGLPQAVRALSFEFVPAALDAALPCIERLCALGDYEFNWSQGEQYRLIEPSWISASAMRARLSTLPAGSRSGDIYARRIGIA